MIATRLDDPFGTKGHLCQYVQLTQPRWFADTWVQGKN